MRSITPTVLLALAACATPNPPPSNTPALWTNSEQSAAAKTAQADAATKPKAPAPPAAAAKEAPATATATKDSAASAAPKEAATQAPAPATTQATPPAATTQASAPAAAPAGAESASTAAHPLVIATVAGRAIDVSELLSQWLHQDSIQVLEQLDRIVLGRLVLAEAERLQLKIEPERAQKAYDAAVGAIEQQIGKKREGVTLDAYVDRVLGLDPALYREHLRDDALRGLLAERVMRAWLLTSEHALVHAIVVRSEDKVQEVQTALAAGRAFEDVAREVSVDASAKDGGRLAPVVGAQTAMGRMAFETKVGAVGGPLFEKGAWLFVRVDARPTVLQGAWPELASAVEASLKERGIEDLEMSQWKAAMLARYQVDIAPFLKLVGQPTK